MEPECENTDNKLLDIKSQAEVQQKEQTKTTSHFEFIKIVKQTTSTVVLEWQYSDEKTIEGSEKVFKIVKLQNRNEWETIIWTKKSMCVIKNLEQNTCYSIKILVMVQTYERFVETDSSNILKVIHAALKIADDKILLQIFIYSARYRSFHHTRHSLEQFKNVNYI